MLPRRAIILRYLSQAEKKSIRKQGFAKYSTVDGKNKIKIPAYRRLTTRVFGHSLSGESGNSCVRCLEGVKLPTIS